MAHHHEVAQRHDNVKTLQKEIFHLEQGGCMILQFMNRSSEAQVTSFGRINVRFKITQDKNMIISKGGVRKKKKDNFVILFEFVKIHLLKQKNITAHA